MKTCQLIEGYDIYTNTLEPNKDSLIMSQNLLLVLAVFDFPNTTCSTQIDL